MIETAKQSRVNTNDYNYMQIWINRRILNDIKQAWTGIFMWMDFDKYIKIVKNKPQVFRATGY